jgi:hypothetical protein
MAIQARLHPSTTRTPMRWTAFSLLRRRFAISGKEVAWKHQIFHMLVTRGLHGKTADHYVPSAPRIELATKVTEVRR